MSTLHGRLLVLVISIASVLLSANGAAASAPFLYAMRQGTGGANQIFCFRLDPATGVLTPVPGFPVATGGTGGPARFEQLVVGGGRLFVLNDGSNTLSAFAVNFVTGALTPLPFSPVGLGSGSWKAMAVHPTGSPLLLGDTVTSSLASFVVTASTFTPASGSPFAMGVVSDPMAMAFSRDGNHVYAGGNVGNRIAGFRVAVSTGVLTALAGSPFDSGNALPVAYATDEAGRLFIANRDAGELRVFTTSAGVPAGVTGNPFLSGLPTGTLRRGGVMHPAGFYMVSDTSGRHVGVYRISGSGAGTTLAAVAGSPFSTELVWVSRLALTPDGSLLVATSLTSQLIVFKVNPATGALSPVVQPLVFAGGLMTGLALVPALTAVGDFNADRNADLLWRNNVTGQNIGWLMNGAAVSSSAFLSTIANTNWEVTGTGDFDANGQADVIWRHRTTGQNIAWLMNGLTVSLSTFLPTIADTNWDMRGVGDFDGDGRADVIWRNQATGQNVVWLMNGASVASSAFLLPIPDTNWQIVGVGDVDGNGTADVLWRSTVTGQNSAWLMNGGAIGAVAPLPTLSNTNWEVKGVGDLGGNAKADIIWRNRVTGQYIAWQMNGTTVASTTSLAAITDLNWQIKAVRDVNGDTHADLIWRNAVTGQNLVWLMNGFAIKSATFLPTIADVNWEIVGQ